MNASSAKICCDGHGRCVKPRLSQEQSLNFALCEVVPLWQEDDFVNLTYDEPEGLQDQQDDATTIYYLD